MSLTTTTPLFAAILAAVFAVVVGDRADAVDPHHLHHPPRGVLLARDLFAFALGTAAGDLSAEKLDLGYGVSIAIFGTIIAVVVLAHFGFGLNAVLSFWLAYIMTRPLGASIGDFLSQHSSSTAASASAPRARATCSSAASSRS